MFLINLLVFDRNHDIKKYQLKATKASIKMPVTIDEVIQKSHQTVMAANIKHKRITSDLLSSDEKKAKSAEKKYEEMHKNSNLAKDKQEIWKAMQDRDQFRKTLGSAMSLFQPEIQKVLHKNKKY